MAPLTLGLAPPSETSSPSSQTDSGDQSAAALRYDTLSLAPPSNGNFKPSAYILLGWSSDNDLHLAAFLFSRNKEASDASSNPFFPFLLSKQLPNHQTCAPLHPPGFDSSERVTTCCTLTVGGHFVFGLTFSSFGGQVDLLQALVQSAQVDPGEVVGSVSLLRHDQSQLRRQDEVVRSRSRSPQHRFSSASDALASAAHLVLAVGSGLLVVDGEEQHVSELQICRETKRGQFKVLWRLLDWRRWAAWWRPSSAVEKENISSPEQG